MSACGTDWGLVVFASIGGLAVAILSGLGLGWALMKWVDKMDGRR